MKRCVVLKAAPWWGALRSHGGLITCLVRRLCSICRGASSKSGSQGFLTGFRQDFARLHASRSAGAKLTTLAWESLAGLREADEIADEHADSPVGVPAPDRSGPPPPGGSGMMNSAGLTFTGILSARAASCTTTQSMECWYEAMVGVMRVDALDVLARGDSAGSHARP